MSDTQTERQAGEFTGEVKWFNNRRGYGFLRIVSGDRTNEDVFVHQSYVCPQTSEYRALYQGEYVSFNIKEATETERSQAIDVTGVGGGPLQCDQARPRTTGRGRGGGRGGRSRGGRGGHSHGGNQSGASAE